MLNPRRISTFSFLKSAVLAHNTLKPTRLPLRPRAIIKSFLFVSLACGLTVSVCAQSVTDGTTPGALTPGAPAGSYLLSGFVSCQYDSNGNLTQRSDARGVISTHAYDALNRNISVTYANGPANTPAVTRTYDNPTSGANGKGRLWKSQTNGGTGSRTTIDSYDALGRPLSQSQEFFAHQNWTSFSMSATYDKAGHILTETYPSGHQVAYNYDKAGRLADQNTQSLAFTGNLGDETTRNYVTGIVYDAASRITQEKFGAETPVYNKLAYNVRGQLSEIRLSTSGNDTSWNRGKIINDYSLQCSGADCNATDNNGNLRKQTVSVPNNEQNTSATSWYQQYDYDSLNRLMQVDEYAGCGLDWQQAYTYDRYGNRKIDAGSTFGTGINAMQAAVDANTLTNRLYAPNDPTHTLIDYDDAGNQTKDFLTSNGTRVYDAENRLISAPDSNENTNEYTYDGP